MSRSIVSVQGREMELSNLDKDLYPSGFSKADVIDYYRRIAPLVLPHLRDRPITLKRYPNGSQGMFFYQKRAPEHRPDWLRTARISTKSDAIDFCIIEDVPGLVWLANLACLEIHTYLARAQAPTVPTMLVFDLDPGAPAELLDCCRVAQQLQQLLRGLGVECLAKVSGSKGIHVCVPLNSPVSFDQTKMFAHAVARTLELQSPATVTSSMAKSERAGKVFIDWSQNDPSKTTCCVYSLRALPTPMVSAPISWEQIQRAVASRKAGSLLQDAPMVVQRAGHPDAFASLETLIQRLPEPEHAAEGARAAHKVKRPAPRRGRAAAPRKIARAR